MHEMHETGEQVDMDFVDSDQENREASSDDEEESSEDEA
jgi:hypothetical protein